MSVGIDSPLAAINIFNNQPFSLDLWLFSVEKATMPEWEEVAFRLIGRGLPSLRHAA